MRINTNVSALNAQRQLGITNANVSQSITRLSSGFRINRAADDAAGLGIANKLRGDIRSMTQAARNGEQANSLAQIAEGAVSGIASMLDRMKELATQANSDTVDDAGRERLQAEFTALANEIQRTAETTQFGQTKLINGGFGSKIDAATTLLLDGSGDGSEIPGLTTVRLNGAQADTYSLDGSVADKLTVTNSAGTKSQTVDLTDSTTGEVSFSEFGITLVLDGNADESDLDGNDIVVEGGSGEFMVGSSGAYNSTTGDLLAFASIDVTTDTLGLTDSGDPTNDLKVTSAADARTALEGIDAAIASVNEALGAIGAFQNRVENAVANVKTAIENLSASESVIRDLDMADEMTKFSKNQILQQAGTAMLAQANQSSQNVLQLLRG